MPEKLNNLVMDDFIHPDDLSAVKALKKVPGAEKIVSFMEDRNNQMIVRMSTLGNCIKLTGQNFPRVYGIVKDVCEIMGYENMPEVYTRRGYEPDVIPSGVDKPVVVIPNYAIKNFGDDLLYFAVGRAVTRLKSGHLKFYAAAQIMVSVTGFFPVISDAVILPLANWMRKSELTADRGGLLVCQNYTAAMKFLMYKAGMPVKDSQNINIPEYIEACKSENKIANAGKGMKTLRNCTGWANDRIIELFTWHAKGQYDDLLEKYI